MRSFLMASILALLAGCTRPTDPPRDLFSRVDPPLAPVSAALLRTQQVAIETGVLVRLNHAILSEIRGEAAAWRPFNVNTIIGGTTEMTTTSYATVAPGIERWRARGADGSTLDIFLENGKATGILTVGGAEMRIYGGVEDRVQRLVVLDERRRLEGPDALSNPLVAPRRKKAKSAAVICDDDHGISVPVGKGARPTVMVLWTPAAEAWLRSQGRSIGSEIQQIMATMEAAMSGTWTAVYPSLVHQQEIPVSEQGPEMKADLEAMTNGNIADVHMLRDRHRADLVMLIGHYPRATACGLAWVNDNAAQVDASQYGYSVNNVDVETSSYCDFPTTPVHEVGHNMGMRHDRASGGSSRLPYNFGHVSIAAKQRTIMAYDTACQAQGISCRRLMRFSTPRESYPKDGPMGVRADQPGAAHNMEALCRLAPHVERFR